MSTIDDENNKQQIYDKIYRDGYRDGFQDGINHAKKELYSIPGYPSIPFTNDKSCSKCGMLLVENMQYVCFRSGCPFNATC